MFLVSKALDRDDIDVGVDMPRHARPKIALAVIAALIVLVVLYAVFSGKQ